MVPTLPMLSRALWSENIRNVVAAEALESPDDAASLQIERSSMPFPVKRSSADVRDGFYGAVRLLLFESGSEPVDAGVAVHVKRACAVGDGVPTREK